MSTDMIKEIRKGIEQNLVDISGIAEGYGRWKPDLRVDARLNDKLEKLAKLCWNDKSFGADFMLPVSSCYRPFNPQGFEYERRDAKDPRGHWTGLAIDIGYRNVLPKRLWKKFIKYAKKSGLYRIHLVRYGEWWHFSRYGLSHKRWRPVDWISDMRWVVLKKLYIV